MWVFRIFYHLMSWQPEFWSKQESRVMVHRFENIGKAKFTSTMIWLNDRAGSRGYIIYFVSHFIWFYSFVLVVLWFPKRYIYFVYIKMDSYLITTFWTQVELKSNLWTKGCKQPSRASVANRITATSIFQELRRQSQYLKCTWHEFHLPPSC